MDLRTSSLNRYVREVFGDDQVDLFRFGWRSLEERVNFASYHLDEMKRLVLPYTASGGPQPGLDRIFVAAIGHARAHVMACLQSLHAIGDICAHGVYYALGSNLEGPPLDVRRIDAGRVLKMVRHDGPATAFASLVDHPEFRYLQDVVNRSKHCSVVSTNYTFDVLERDQVKGWHGLAIWRFEHHGIAYPVRRAEEFLTGELARQKQSLAEIALALEAVLKGNWDQLKAEYGAAWPIRDMPDDEVEGDGG